jgi:cytosine/adenosine deaminase-related metal-dependent hydrolase
MMQEVAFAFFKHRDAGGSLWPPSFLAMLDRGNRILDRYFEADNIRFGRVETGHAADLVFWDYDPPTPLQDGNVGGHIMFGMSSRAVHSVMVNGKFVVKDRIPQFDAKKIYTQSREQTVRLWKRMEERK